MADYLELPPGERVELIAPPARLLGKTIDHSGIRAEFHVTVLAVRVDSPGGRAPRLIEPTPDHRAGDRERWLVKGTRESIERFRKS
jgi:hypothetical protein